MKAGSRPQYYRIRRMVQMVREGTETGYLPNSGDFMKEFEVSRRTVARDLDFLRDEERAPLAYDDARHGFRLTDETYTLPPVRISRKEAFSFGLARKLLAHYEGTPLHLDMRSVLDKIAESLEGDITIEPDWLSEHVGVMPEDCVRIDPEVWAQIAGFIERRERIRATYQTFDGRISEYTLYIGKPMPWKKLESFESDEAMVNYLRLNTYFLQNRAHQKRFKFHLFLLYHNRHSV